MRRTVSQAGRQASRQCKVSAGREEISVHTLCTHIDTGIRAHNTKREREREARIRALARTQTDTSTESDPPAQAGHNNEATQRTMHATGFLVSHTERLSVYYASYSDWSTSGCRKSSIHPSIQHAHWLDGATAYTQTHTRRLLHSVCGTVVDSEGGTKTALRSLCMWCCSSLSLCLSISPQHMSLHVCIIILHMAIACMEHSRPSSACMCINIRIFLKWSALSPCTTQGLLLWLWLPARPLSICIRSLAWVCVCRAPSLVVVLHFRTGLAAQSAHTSSTLLTAWISPITDIHVRGACQQQSVCFCWRARFRAQPALSGCRHERQKRRENSRACTAMHFPTATNAYTVHQKFSSI